MEELLTEEPVVEVSQENLTQVDAWLNLPGVILARHTGEAHSGDQEEPIKQPDEVLHPEYEAEWDQNCLNQEVNSSSKR